MFAFAVSCAPGDSPVPAAAQKLQNCSVVAVSGALDGAAAERHVSVARSRCVEGSLGWRGVVWRGAGRLGGVYGGVERLGGTCRTADALARAAWQVWPLNRELVESRGKLGGNWMRAGTLPSTPRLRGVNIRYY